MRKFCTDLCVKFGNSISKGVYYLLSWTWGFILTLLGFIVTTVIGIFTKQKLKNFGNAKYMYVFDNWGGLELGMYFICGKNSPKHTKLHELGHSYQNIVFGPFMLIFVTIPSAIRYWVRYFKKKSDKPITTAYDDVWFEGSATDIGTAMYSVSDIE